MTEALDYLKIVGADQQQREGLNLFGLRKEILIMILVQHKDPDQVPKCHGENWKV